LAEIAGQPVSSDLAEMSLLDRCKAVEQAGMAVTNSWAALWSEAISYFLSQQLKGYKRHKNWEWVVLNYLWPSIQAELAKLSRRFKFVASPIEPGDTDIAEALQGFLQWQWDTGLKQGGMRRENIKCLLCGKLYGYWISKIYWDRKITWSSEQRQWLGDVKHRLWHPAFFWASDKEYINEGDCGTVRYLELEYAQSLWPKKKKVLKEQSVGYADMIRHISHGDTIHGQTSHQGTYPSKGTGDVDSHSADKLSSTLLSLVVSESTQQGNSTDVRRYCRISEQYLKNYKESNKQEESPADPAVLMESGQLIQDAVTGGYMDRNGLPVTSENWPVNVTEWREPDYPNGQYIIRNEDEILNPDPDTQIYPHSRWPFVVCPHYLLPFMWQGSDAISLYRDTQDKINVAVSHLFNNAKEFGDPKIAVEENALLVDPRNAKKKYEILKGAGAIIKLVRGGLSRFKVIEPKAPSAAHMMIYQMMVQEFKNIQGMQDIALGKKTTGDTTATEAQHLAMSANDRIKLQNLFQEEWARDLIRLVAEMDQYYYEAGRVVRVVGDDMMIGAVQITDRSKEAKFDVNIEPTEGMPWDEEKRILRYEKAYTILQDPRPNPLLPEYLRVLQITAWQKILEKHEKWQDWIGFEQLIEAVEAGQLAPEQALQMLIEKARQRIMSMQAVGDASNGNSDSRKESA